MTPLPIISFKYYWESFIKVLLPVIGLFVLYIIIVAGIVLFIFTHLFKT